MIIAFMQSLTALGTHRAARPMPSVIVNNFLKKPLDFLLKMGYIISMTNKTTKTPTKPLRRDDLPTVEQNARLFRSLARLQAKAKGKKVWR